MTRSELVKRAISFEGPSRVPVWFWNEDKERSDILSFDLVPYKWDVKTSEWGYVWEDLGDGTIGQGRYCYWYAFGDLYPAPQGRAFHH